MPATEFCYSDYPKVRRALELLNGFALLRFSKTKESSYELLCCKADWTLDYTAGDGPPAKFIKRLLAKKTHTQTTPSHPLAHVFNGGLVGYLSYEFGHHAVTESSDCNNYAGTDSETLMPLAYVSQYTNYLVVDHEQELISGHLSEDVHCELLQTLDKLASIPEKTDLTTGFSVSPFIPEWSARDYKEAFSKIRHYIYSGDVYQVNLTQRFVSDFTGMTTDLFDSTDSQTKAPHAAFMPTAKGDVLCFSPESFLSIQGRKIITKPIKGTRPRGTTEKQDSEIARELTLSSKDRAENVMIVDLLRNDLGKVAETGSVEVPELCALESFSNVHHLVSTVTATLKEEVHPLEALFACMPGGSITGAPKKRAMEIIRELEATARDAYCGTLFFCADNGRLESNIAIRTMICQQGKAYLWGGGGIVADSEWQEEYRESIVKIRHIARALGSDIQLS